MTLGCPQSVFEETADPGEGNSSAKLVNTFWALGSNIIGNDTIPGILMQSYAISDKPNAFSFQYKSDLVGNDQGLFYLELTRWDAINDMQVEVATGAYIISSSETNWVNVTQGINYTSTDSPDSVHLYAVASADVLVGDGAFGRRQIGTTVYIDSVVVSTLTGCAGLDYSVVTQQNDDCGNGSGYVWGYAGGGTYPYTYNWSNGQTDNAGFGLTAGTHTVTITDAAGCEASKTFTLTGGVQMNITVTTTNATCGGSDGTAAVIIDGGMSPYTYEWNVGQTTESATGLEAGVVIITVTDAQGCQNQNGNAVNNDNAPNWVAFDVTPPLCYGSNDGIAYAEVSGGATPYNYQWEDINGNILSSSQTMTGVSGGTLIIVRITDNDGCVLIGGEEVNEPELLWTMVSTMNESVPGASDGTAYVSVYGGTTPYSYEWSNGSTSETITGLTSGTYTYTVTDINGCSSSDAFSLNASCDLLVDATIVNDPCGQSNGSISLSVSNGIEPFTYQWSNNGFNVSFNNAIGAGNYQVTITDDMGCVAIESFDVTGGTAMDVSINVTNPSCGNADGEASVDITGGTSPYSYYWYDEFNDVLFGTTATVTGLNTGGIWVTVTDANGCTKDDSGPVNNSNAPTVNLTKIDALCGELGLLLASASGGATPYTYEWVNGDNPGVVIGTGESLTDLTGGFYGLAVTDAMGCVSVNGRDIFETDAVSLTLTSSDVSSAGASDGSADVVATGGNSSYTYNWSNGESNDAISGLSGGIYTVTVTDSDGCEGIESVAVSEPGVCSLGAEVNTTNASLNGASDGTASAVAIGGTSSFTYEWSNGSTEPSITGLTDGTYSVTITDANSCTAEASGTVAEPACAVNLMLNATDVTVFGGSDGSVNTTILDGLSPYTYSWSNSSSSATLSGVVAGTYSLTVTDAASCTATSSATVGQPSGISERLESRVRMYPNPTNGMITVEFSSKSFATIEVYDMLGQIQHSTNAVSGKTSLDLSNVESGIYLVVVKENEVVTKTERVIKK